MPPEVAADSKRDLRLAAEHHGSRSHSIERRRQVQVSYRGYLVRVEPSEGRFCHATAWWMLRNGLLVARDESSRSSRGLQGPLRAKFPILVSWKT